MSGSAFQWSSASLTHAGKIRRVNEDACLELPWKGLWVVADGMGGHSAGDVASQMVVKTLGEIGSHNQPGNMLDDLEDRLIDANARLYGMRGADGKDKTIGCTVAAVLAFNGFCVCAWAGDSRIYRYRNGSLEQISTDHSQVEELIERGEILREDAESHPLANVVTRAVGGDATFALDIEFEPLAHGDRYMICSDGLTKELDVQDMLACLAQNNNVDATRSLIQRVLAGEASDNVTVAVIDFERVGRAPAK